jgi:hypothetical protein
LIVNARVHTCRVSSTLQIICVLQHTGVHMCHSGFFCVSCMRPVAFPLSRVLMFASISELLVGLSFLGSSSISRECR